MSCRVTHEYERPSDSVIASDRRERGNLSVLGYEGGTVRLLQSPSLRSGSLAMTRAGDFRTETPESSAARLRNWPQQISNQLRLLPSFICPFCLLNYSNLLFCQSVEVVDEPINQPVGRVNLALEPGLIIRRLRRSQLLVQLQHLLDQLYRIIVACFI